MDGLGHSDPSVRYSNLRELVGVVRHEWSTRKAWKTWRAALRGTWWWLVRRYPCELCQDCGRPVGHELGDTYWHGPDDLWNTVMGWPGWEQEYGEYAYLGVGGTVCAGCFTRRADAKGIRLHWEAVAGA